MPLRKRLQICPQCLTDIVFMKAVINHYNHVAGPSSSSLSPKDLNLSDDDDQPHTTLEFTDYQHYSLGVQIEMTSFEYHGRIKKSRLILILIPTPQCLTLLWILTPLKRRIMKSPCKRR